MPWLYQAARRLFRRGVRFYFLDAEHVGREHIPAHGATILASNHPGSLMDTVVLASMVPRTVHYLARSGLFRPAPVAKLLRVAGAIPVTRRQDLPKDANPNNAVAFDAAHQVLADGRVLGIFPEGQNSPERHVRDIKTGCARIGLEAEAQHGFSLDVRIIPIGINYEEREQFLSRVLVRFGPPIELRHYQAAYEADPRGTVREVTDRLQEAMREAATHIREGHETLVESIDSLVGEELTDELLPHIDLRTFDERLMRSARGRGGPTSNLEGRFRVRQWIGDAVDYFERTAPAKVARLSRDIERYMLQLQRMRLRDDFTKRSATGKSSRWQAIRMMAYALLLGPFALYGLVHNFIPYRLTRRFALSAPDDAMIAIRAFGGGLVLFGAMYAFFFAVARQGTSWPGALAYLATLPAAGVWFLRYRRTLQRMRDRLVFRELFQTARLRMRRLLIRRTALITQIDGLRREYAAYRKATRTEGDDPSRADDSLAT